MQLGEACLPSPCSLRIQSLKFLCEKNNTCLILLSTTCLQLVIYVESRIVCAVCCWLSLWRKLKLSKRHGSRIVKKWIISSLKLVCLSFCDDQWCVVEEIAKEAGFDVLLLCGFVCDLMNCTELYVTHMTTNTGMVSVTCFFVVNKEFPNF